ncbi:MAG: MFS transporter [Oscillospiraceae bacterium]|nr:MFS transporter [Oscillospiraceae bacterium]
MKLNYKRTILVGFAFFLISAFWQAYDATIPVILTNKFGLSQFWSGAIMALDNIMAVFLLPVFGALSDKCIGKRFGKRTPFITIGTIIAAIALVCLSFVDSAQLKNMTDVAVIDRPDSLEAIYDCHMGNTLTTPDGEEFVINEMFTREQYISITSQIPDPENPEKMITNPDYTNYVVPARQAYAAIRTSVNPTPLIVFIAVLFVVLLAMAVFRSPAVALMPDVTIKPLRSKANAIINLMGTAGGILVLVLGMVFATSAVHNQLMNYTVYYCVIAGIMLAALVVFLLTVKEKSWAAQMQKDSVAFGLTEEQTQTAGNRKLRPAEVRSIILILASIALWYFGYNAVTSKYAVYAGNILSMDYNTTLLIAQGAAIVAYLPAGIVASKIGRRKTILAGVVMLATAFSAASFMRSGSSVLVMNILFALAGIGWATINVNSFPMVVEMCSGGNIGKYTGFYYTASMSAQIVTPMLSGVLMDKMGMTVLFPYAAVFVALAFITMFFVRHGDTKVVSKKGLEALDIDD